MNRLFIVDRMDGTVGTDRTGGSDGIDGLDGTDGTDGTMIFLHRKWYSWPKISTFRVNRGRSGQPYLIRFFRFCSFRWGNPAICIQIHVRISVHPNVSE